MASMRSLSRRNRQQRSTLAKFQLASERLEQRWLLAADPSLSLALSPQTIAENAGAGAVVGTITRNNADTSQALTVNLTSSNSSHATVASSVTIPAGQTSANFSVNPVDDGIADAGHSVTITGYSASPIAAGLDATFGSGGYANLTTLAAPTTANFPDVKVQPDGKIVAVASSSVSGVTWALSRTLPDGTPDPTFGTNGVVQTTFPNEGYVTADGANALALQPDGKIVVTGIIAGVPGDNYQDWGIARYNSDGTLDSSFGNGGFVRISFPGEGAWPYDVAVLSNGEILVAGNGGGGYTVARLASNGQLDPNFGSSGIAHVAFDPTLLTYGTVYAMAVRPDGRIVLAGGADGNYLAVASLNADGTPDTTFGGNGLALIPLADFGSFTYAAGMGVALQPDGKVVVAGYASGGSTTFGDFITARLNTNGTLDTSFSGDGVDAFNFSGNEGQANDVAIQADGKILLAGWTNVGGLGPFYGQGFNLALARYNPDGTLDASFHDSKFNSPGKYVFDGLSSIFEEIWGVDLQSDGKLAAIVGYNNDLKAARFDTGLLAASQTLNVTNADGGPNPAAADDSYAMLQNDTLSVAAPGLLGNDTAVNSTPLTASLVSGPSHGNLTLNADGSFTYTPASGFFGTDSFSYQDAEGALASNVAAVTITVQAPNAAGDSYSMTENDVLTVAAPGVLGNDTAVTSSALSAVLVSGPSHGALTLNADGSFTYAPNANFFGTDSFTYKDSEGTLSSNVAIATISIRAPLAASDSYTVDENTVLSVVAPGVLGNDSAANSTPLTAVLVSGPSHGTLTLNADGSFVYTPNVNYYGADSFVYKDAEGGVFSNTAAVSITINRVDHAPVAANDSYAAAAGRTRLVLAPGVLANDSDPDSDPLTAVLVSGPSHGSLTLNSNGSFTYTPVASYSGADSFTYRAYDGLLYSGVATVSLTVDQPPVVQNASYTLDENSSVAVPITGSDVETPTAQLVFVVAQLPAHGSLTDPNGNAVTAGERFTGPVTLNYAPANDYFGSDSFSYYAVDDQFSGNGGVISLTVNHVNQPPVAVNDAYSTNEDAPLTVIGPGVTSLSMQSDPGDWVGGGGNYAFTPATGVFSAAHSSNDNDLIFQYHDASYSQWWYLEFAAPLGAPLVVGTYLNAGRAAFRPDTQPGMDVYGDGRGSNTLTGSFVVTQAVYDSNGAVVSFDATFEQHSEGLTPALRGEIKYNAIPPMTGVLLNDTDVDSPTLTAALVGGPSHGTVQLNADGSFTYTPDANFNGVDSFTYKANDGLLDSNVATATINVNPVNDAPGFTKGADQAIAEGAGPQAIAGWATNISAGPPDEASQALNFQVSTNNDALFAAAPSIDPSTGTLTYTPAQGAVGSATVTVDLHDNGGTANGGVDTSAPQTFTISIGNVAPTVSLVGSASVNEGDTLSTNGSFTDPGVETWTATIDYGDGGGAQPLALNPDKTFSLSHVYADNGVYHVTVAVNDSNNGSGSSSMLVTVNNVAPTAVLANNGPVNEGSAATISFSSPFDPSSADTAAGFHYSFAVSAAGLAGSYAAAGTASSSSFTFGDNGSYTVYGRIFDKDGGFTDYTTLVTVNNVAPTAVLANSGPVNEGSAATISFSSPFDPSSADTAAGFHYSFAVSAAGLAGSYAAAGAASSSSFTFGDNGTYTVYGRVFDKDGGFTDYTTLVTVNNVAPTAVLANNGPVNEGSASTISFGSPVDPSSADTAAGFHYSFAISTSALASDYASAGAASSSSLTFDDNGTYTVYGRIFDKDNGYTDYSTVVTVNNVAPTASLSNSGPVGEGAVVKVTFGAPVDPSSADASAGFHYSLAFDTSALASSYGAASPANWGTYLFSDNGSYTVYGRIFDKDGGYSDYATVVTVNNIAPTATLLAPAAVGENSSVEVMLSSPFDPSTVDTTTGFHYAFAFNDSSAFDVGDGTYAGSGAANAAEIPAALVADGPSTVTIRARIIDKDGGFTDYVQVMTVTNRAPTAVMVAPSSITEGSSVVAAVGLSGSDPSAVDNAAGLRYAYDFNNDGTFDLGDGSYAGSVSDSSAVIPENFRDDGPGQLTVRERIIDKDGGYNDYTATIAITNVAPTAVLSNNGPANEGSAAVISFANPFDPSTTDTQAGFHYSFAVSAAGLAGSYVAAGTGSSSSFTFADNGSYTVYGRIFDKDGGFTDYSTVVTVNNVAPTAVLANSGPVNEGSAATISFSSPFDPSSADTAAGFHYSFAVSAAGLAGSYAAAGAASSSSFTFGDNGTYTVYGRVFDKDGGHTDYSTAVTVNNVAPTAVLANSGPVNEGLSATISFSSPFDPSSADTAAGFHYSFAINATALASDYASAGAASSSSLTFDDNGTYTVYGRIFDKDNGYTDYSTVVTVNNVAPTASISGANVGVRGQTLTFAIGASDPSPVDQAGSFSYLIDWGDGTTPETIAGSANASAAHVFSNSGSFAIQVWATDKDGGQSASPAKFTLPVQSAALENETLVVGGTTAADTIVISPANLSGGLNVVINGQSAGVFAPTTEIVVYAQAGDDHVQLKTAKIHGTTAYVAVEAALFGGDGADTLDARGSKASNILVGGAGNDTLYGGSGRNLLIGGLGSDRLYGGSADDILIGGTTDYDANLAALNAIMAEWARTDLSYQARVDQLTGAASGGLNGPYLLTSNTVHDDATVDRLYGNGGSDWFFYDLAGPAVKRSSRN